MLSGIICFFFSRFPADLSPVFLWNYTSTEVNKRAASGLQFLLTTGTWKCLKSISASESTPSTAGPKLSQAIPWTVSLQMMATVCPPPPHSQHKQDLLAFSWWWLVHHWPIKPGNFPTVGQSLCTLRQSRLKLTVSLSGLTGFLWPGHDAVSTDALQLTAVVSQCSCCDN